MKRRFRLPVRQKQVLLLLLILSVAGYVSMQFLPSLFIPSPPQESSPRTLSARDLEPSPVKTQESVDTDQGLKVYVDPETGEFRRPPAHGEGDEAIPFGVEDTRPEARSDEPLEFMSPMAGGGVVAKVRLRFRRPLMATKDADGNLTIQHVPRDEDLREQR